MIFNPKLWTLLGALFLLNVPLMLLLPILRTRDRRKRIVLLSLAVLCTLVGIALFIPFAQQARAKAQADRCSANLQRIAAAKRSWAAQTKPELSATAQPADLAPFLKAGKLPICLAGGTYTLGAVNEPPRCSLAHQGHKLE